MRHIILISVIFALSVTMVEAQRGFNGAGYSPGIHPMLTTDMEDLNLTEDQKSEIAELMVEMRSANRSVYRNQRSTRGNRGNMRSNRRSGNNNKGLTQRFERRSEVDGKMMEILTDDQKNILAQKAVERIENAHEFRMLQHEVMLDKAGLESDKKDRVLEIMEEHSNEMLHERKEALSNSEFYIGYRAENFERRVEMENQIKEILTAAEFEQFQEVMGMRPYSRRGNNRGLRLRNR